MNEVILTSIKKLIGVTEEYTVFDGDIIICINGVFGILTQLGVGPDTGFSLKTGDETWEDYLGAAYSDLTNLEMIKSYMAGKVRLMFDPPQSGVVKESLERIVAELEWRINVMVDPEDKFVI
ncbi:MAG: hypothetical protein J6U54_18050 [Clostridiales bacterium]|nr:hypothetical protein [Clostridiales bacterium]